MNILVTGGTGFLGEEFLRFAHKKYKIYATYRTESGIKLKNVTWINLDLVKKETFDKAFSKLKNKIDRVIHIGGASPNRAYAEGNFKATTEGTKNFIAFSKKLKIKKFVYISSIVVDFPYNGPYSNSKRIAENYLKKSGLTFTMLRPETIIGKRAKDFQRVVKFLQNHRFMPIVGNGNNLTQPISSHDLIKMIDFSLKNNITDNKIYPAVGKKPVKLKTFLKKISNKIILIPLPVFLCKLIAKIADKINPKWGLNEERINILTHSRNYTLDLMKDFERK